MSDYRAEQNQMDTLHLRRILDELPPFLNEFFRGIAQNTSAKSRLGYARDLKIFFVYILENHPDFSGKEMKSIGAAELDLITAEDIDLFMEYITYYTNDERRTIANNEKGKARKLAAIRSMYKFFYKKHRISANPAAVVDGPKIHDKTIVRLEPDELATLLDEVESGDKLTDRQKKFHEYTRTRDLALITLLAGTGMRVSECVGINISDIDFKTNGVKVTRKGGNESVLYFGSEVCDALKDLLSEREKAVTRDSEEKALFLSLQGKRISVRAVQNLVKKYSSAVVSLKKISPHKLRSTYGTNLYRETSDIYLVADVLGHSDVNTTKKHYAELEENRRKKAADYIKLRKE